MRNVITSEIVVAYSQCPRKAFLMLCTDEQGMPHEYMHIIEQQKSLNQTKYMNMLNVFKPTTLEEKTYIVSDLARKGNLVIEATLKIEFLEAYCDVLTKIESRFIPR